MCLCLCTVKGVRILYVPLFMYSKGCMYCMCVYFYVYLSVYVLHIFLCLCIVKCVFNVYVFMFMYT